MIFFEEIFDKVIVLWKEKYYFSQRKDTAGAICSVKIDFKEIICYTEEKYAKKFNDWEKVMVFIIAQVITDYSFQLLEKNKRCLNIKRITMCAFEKQWIENFIYLKRWNLKEFEEFKKCYQGFKDKKNAFLFLEEYLQIHSLLLRKDDLV